MDAVSNSLFEPPPQLRPFDVPGNDESTYLLTQNDLIQATSPSARRSAKDPTAFVVDQYTPVYKAKSDAFEVFPRVERFINAESSFKCPVCSKKKANFFCPSCVRNGNFTHSKANFFERFADKKLQFIHLKEQQIQTSNKVKKHFTNLALKDELKLQVQKVDQNLKTLRKIINEKKNYLKEIQGELNDTKRNVISCQGKHLHLKSRIHNIKNIIAKQNVAINEQQGSKASEDNRIQILIREKLLTLTTYIYQFCVEDANNLDDSMERYDMSMSGSESAPLLNNSSESSPGTPLISREVNFLPVIRYRLIDAWITSNENFNLFLVATQLNRVEYVELRENNFRNDEYRLTTVLSYLCHLTNLIAIFCDVHLPKRLLFSEFYFREFKREDFLSKIAKLNTNILFLCIYHHIDPSLLQPKQAFKNLMLVLNCQNFIGVLDNFVDISNAFYKTIQDQLMADLCLTEKEDYEASVEHADEHDYDFVDQSNIPDLDFSEFSSNDQTTSTSANLLALVSSIWSDGRSIFKK